MEGSIHGKSRSSLDGEKKGKSHMKNWMTTRGSPMT